MALTPLGANKLGGKQYRKHLKQVHIASLSDICFPINKCIDNNADAQLQYAASRQKEISGLFEKSCLVEQIDNKKNKKFVLTQLPTMQHWAYIQSISYFNPDFYICSSFKKILLLDISSDCLIKVIKLLHDMQKVSINSFAAYHPHYKEKLEITLIKLAYNLFFFRLLLKPLSPIGISSNFIMKFTTYHPYYKEIPRIMKCTYDFFLLQLPRKRIFLLGTSSN